MNRTNDRYNQYVNQSDTSNTPRPEWGDRTTSEWVKLTSEEQRQVTREYNARLVKESRERVMALQVKIDQDRKAREEAAAAEADARRRAKLEGDVKRSFLASGGTEAEFEKVGEKLVLEHIEAVTKDRMERDRAAMKARLARF